MEEIKKQTNFQIYQKKDGRTLHKLNSKLNKIKLNT